MGQGQVYPHYHPVFTGNFREQILSNFTNMNEGCVRLKDLTKHFTTRTDDSHATPVINDYYFHLQIIKGSNQLSRAGKVLRVLSN